MKYQVRDNDKPAMYPYCNVDKSWGSCEFNTLEEAIEYIHLWLSEDFSPGIPELKKIFSEEKTYEYNPGDSISILEIEEGENCEVPEITEQRIKDALELLNYLEKKIKIL